MRRFPSHVLRPAGPWYAGAPILEAFNWSECLATFPPCQLFLVVFRSVRRESADPILLKSMDDRAYEDALSASGLLHYFRGSLNERRDCLSFCLWETQEAAAMATKRPAHDDAVDITDIMYDSFDLERWYLIKHESGSLEVWPAGAPAHWGALARPPREEPVPPGWQDVTDAVQHVDPSMVQYPAAGGPAMGFGDGTALGAK
jgi:hypothetical protein